MALLPLCGPGRDFACLRLLASPSSRRTWGTCNAVMLISTWGRFGKDGALFFSFALQLTVVIMRATKWLSVTLFSPELKLHVAKVSAKTGCHPSNTERSLANLPAPGGFLVLLGAFDDRLH